jgi:hypothetical protein
VGPESAHGLAEDFEEEAHECLHNTRR